MSIKEKVVENLIEKSFNDLVSLLINNRTNENLIFPKYRDETVRYSEQELRQFFLKNVETQENNDNKIYFYSVETPTKLVYRFTNTEIPKVKDPNDTDDNDKDNYKSARFDVSLYSKNDTNELLSHIEFKYGNPDQKNAICKDFLKLISEVDLTKEKKNFFVHYLCVKTEKGWESKTFPSLFKKYCDSIVDIEKTLKNETNLKNVTIYLLCFFEDSKSSSVYRFSLNDLKNYKVGTKYSDLTDKSWLNEEIFNLGEEIHFKEIKK